MFVHPFFFFLPFFTGVVFLDDCDAWGLPPDGVAEVVLVAAGFKVAEEVFWGAGFAVVREVLVEVGGRAEPVVDWDDAGLKGQDKE